MKSRVALDGVIALIKEVGFKAKGTTLHRDGADSKTIHVVYLQSDRGHLEGKFTVGMGVLVPTVFRLEKEEQPPRFPHIYDCQVGTRISAFAGAGDIWWPSNDPHTFADLHSSTSRDVPLFLPRGVNARPFFADGKKVFQRRAS